MVFYEDPAIPRSFGVERAMILAKDIYAVTNRFPRAEIFGAEIFGLTSQVRRAAVSIPSNIAEGHGRTTDKSFAVFLGQARGSLYELETPLELAFNLEYVEKSAYARLVAESDEIGRMLNGLLSKLKAASEN